MSRFPASFRLSRSSAAAVAVAALLAQGCEPVGFEVVKRSFTLVNEAPTATIPEPEPVVTPSPVVVPPKPVVTPTPTPPVDPLSQACIEGPEIRVVSGVSATSLTAVFHGVGIKGIDYRIVGKDGALKATGHVKPVHNHPEITYSSIEPGDYVLHFKASHCAGSSSLAFKYEPTVVCDPFANGSGANNEKNGIEAQLTYFDPVPSDVTRLQSTESFLPGKPDIVVAPGRVILNRVATPTRPFEEGFINQATGEKLRNAQGQALIEYFSLQAQMKIALSEDDQEGDYEIALLTDDGSTLDLDLEGNGKFERIVDNDGWHGNKVGCSVQTVSMSRGKEIPAKLNYFQGPATQIAFMMLWRVKNASSLPEPECGHLRDDDHFFRWVNGQAESTSNYTAMQSRGWKTLSETNFIMPNYQNNPCSKK